MSNGYQHLFDGAAALHDFGNAVLTLFMHKAVEDEEYTYLDAVAEVLESNLAEEEDDAGSV